MIRGRTQPGDSGGGRLEKPHQVPGGPGAGREERGRASPGSGGKQDCTCAEDGGASARGSLAALRREAECTHSSGPINVQGIIGEACSPLICQAVEPDVSWWWGVLLKWMCVCVCGRGWGGLFYMDNENWLGPLFQWPLDITISSTPTTTFQLWAYSWEPLWVTLRVQGTDDKSNS